MLKERNQDLSIPIKAIKQLAANVQYFEKNKINTDN